MRTVPSLALGLLLSACATAPSVPPPVAAAAGPVQTAAGLVIGTLSYQFVDAPAPAQTWVVRFERVDRGAPRDYALAVAMDPQSQSGVFTGALPAGVYAFRDAEHNNQRFTSGALRMPFEVTAGSVQDAGHYAVNSFSRQ